MNPNTSITRQLGALILMLASSTLPAMSQERYPEPPTPVLLPEDSTLNMSPLDAEVDSFIRVVQARNQYNVSGDGLTVAVIDGGINRWHKDFSLGKVRIERNFSTENVADPNDARDFSGHGCNVSSIIAGKSVANGGMNTGIAHKAQIVALKVFPGGAFDKISAALQWVLDNYEQHNISVVNMSLGDSSNATSFSTDNEVLKKQAGLISALREKHIAVVVAAGNSYFSNQSKPGMAFPAIVPQTISTGAVYDIEMVAPPGQHIRDYLDGSFIAHAIPGQCTAFSQRLDQGTGHESRTDVFAPGFFVTAAGPVILKNDGTVDETKSANARTTQDGTSQASPVVSGLVLLLQERYRKLTNNLGGHSFVSSLPPVDLIEDCLRNGGVVFDDVESEADPDADNVVASRMRFIRIDAVSALAELDKRFHADATSLAQQLFNAADLNARKATLQKAKILSVPIAAPSDR